MTSANLDTEREFTQPAAPRVAGPLLASLAVHGTVLFLLVRTVDIPAADALANIERAAVRVSVVMRPPPVPEAPPSSAPDIVPPVPEVPVPDEPRLDEAAPPQTPPAAETGTPVAIATERSGAEDEEEGTSIPGPGAAIQGWTPARVRAAINDTSAQRRSAVTESWLADCVVEQKLHGTRECDEQQQAQDYASAGARSGRQAVEGAFERITGAQQATYLTDQFARESAVLGTMMETGGLAGALAAQRFYLNREYMLYLNGNGAEPLWGAMGNFRADPLGGPRLSLPGPSTTFRCKKGPCFYRYTGFEIDVPETNEEGSFRVVPVVPGARP